MIDESKCVTQKWVMTAVSSRCSRQRKWHIITEITQTKATRSSFFPRPKRENEQKERCVFKVNNWTKWQFPNGLTQRFQLSMRFFWSLSFQFVWLLTIQFIIFTKYYFVMFWIFLSFKLDERCFGAHLIPILFQTVPRIIILFIYRLAFTRFYLTVVCLPSFIA